MHGKVWMFSNLIDDEDIEFMQHEFISYKQAMDYYELGYKPMSTCFAGHVFLGLETDIQIR